MTRKLLSLLLCVLLLVLSAGTCTATELTPQQLETLQKDLQQAQKLLKILKDNSNLSLTEIQLLKMNLVSLETRLETVSKQLEISKEETKTALESLEKLKLSLAEANQLLEKALKESKRRDHEIHMSLLTGVSQSYASLKYSKRMFSSFYFTTGLAVQVRGLGDKVLFETGFSYQF